jgi:hypothetical protein
MSAQPGHQVAGGQVLLVPVLDLSHLGCKVSRGGRGDQRSPAADREEVLDVADRRWGPWQLSNDGLTLEQEGQQIRHDWIELTRCTTSAEVLDTIFHAARHGDVDDALIAGLVRALDDLLDPMANLCSSGEPTTLSDKKLRELLAGGGAR